MKCINCGNEILDNHKFCPECGTPVVANNASLATPVNRQESNHQESNQQQQFGFQQPVEEIEPQIFNANTQRIQHSPVQPVVQHSVPKKKNSLPFIIGIGVAVVLVIAIISIAFEKNNNAEATNRMENVVAEKDTVKEVSTEKEVDDVTTEMVVKETEYRTDITYDDLARTPDNFTNEYIQLSGRVIQVVEGDGETDLRIAINGDYNNVVFVAYDSSITDKRILDDDGVTIYGISKGLYTYESTLGASITVPLILVDKIELTDGMNNGESSQISVSDDDFEITAYDCELYGTYYKYLVIKNNSEVAVEVNGSATAYDASDNKEGIENSSIDILGPGETSLMYFSFWNLDECDHIDYNLSYNTDVYYTPVIKDLAYKETLNSSNVIIEVTNNGDKVAEFVEVYVMLFDSNNNVINVESAYIVDDDNEIKPGDTVEKQISFFDSYDHVEIYLTGRHSKW